MNILSAVSILIYTQSIFVDLH